MKASSAFKHVSDFHTVVPPTYFYHSILTIGRHWKLFQCLPIAS